MPTTIPTTPPAPPLRPLSDIANEAAAALAQHLAPFIERDRLEVRKAAFEEVADVGKHLTPAMSDVIVEAERMRLHYRLNLPEVAAVLMEKHAEYLRAAVHRRADYRRQLAKIAATALAALEEAPPAADPV